MFNWIADMLPKDRIKQLQAQADEARVKADAAKQKAEKRELVAKEARAKAAALAEAMVQAAAAADDAEAKAKRSRDQAQQLADEMVKIVAALEVEMAKVQASAKAQRSTEGKKTMAGYSSGRYECAQCGQSVLITEVVKRLPECPHCGSTRYKDQPVEIAVTSTSSGKKFEPGMYECGGCGDRVAVAKATNKLPKCTYCGQDKLRRI